MSGTTSLRAAASATGEQEQTLAMLLRTLKLPAFAAHQEELARRAGQEGWTCQHYLRQLVELELSERRGRRIERLLKASGLPPDKRLGTLEQEKLPAKVSRQLPALCEGGFVERAENVLAFGLPGRGKMHVVSAIGHELVQRGYEVLGGHLRAGWRGPVGVPG